MVAQGGTAAVERLETDGLLIRGASRPTPTEDTEPCERQSAYGGLVGFALLALRLIIDACPEGMPNRFRGPCHKGWAEEWRALEAPVPPGLHAAACGHRRDPRILWQFGGGGRACAVCAEGDAQPGGADGARAGEGPAQGEIGMTLRALRAGGIQGLGRLSGDPERVAQDLDEPGLGGDDTLIGGQGHRGLDGVATLVD